MIGLFSAVHCLGMCGSIAGALSLSLPGEVRNNATRLTAFVVAYNLGRLISYTGAGALVGLFGEKMADVQILQEGHGAARLLAALVLIAVGLYLTGWVPQLQKMDRLGDPIWRRLEPIGRRLLPIGSLPQAMLFGLIWGWLPCGLVYYVLILTVSTGSALNGALCMLSFGIGTLPAVVGVGFLTGWFTRFARNRTLRQVVGLTLVAGGIASFWVGGH